jgi:putative spermidine/putrescine transport system ATP-binding protein
MAPTSKASEIEAKSITKAFGAFTALDQVSLTVGRGEFLTLLGPSGSGKTTFLMVLSGFEAASSGSLWVDGQDVTGLPAEARGFGMVFQGYALFPHMTVAENIAFPLRVQKRSATDVARRVEEMVAMVGLEGHAHKRPSALSGGQQQRVALARALVYGPPVLLLDEPFSALDKNLRGQMQEEMKRLHRETGTTFVFVTHDQSEALALSTRVAIFDKGRLQQIAAPEEVYERPANRFVAEFLGDINILPVDRAGGRLTFEGQPLACDAIGGAAGHIAVRPEYMGLHLTEPGAGNAIAARLTDLTYQGAETRMGLTTPGGTALILRQPTGALPQGLMPGTPVWLSWPAGRAFAL